MTPPYNIEGYIVDYRDRQPQRAKQRDKAPPAGEFLRSDHGDTYDYHSQHAQGQAASVILKMMLSAPRSLVASKKPKINASTRPTS
jgi:hypothetical protein